MKADKHLTLANGQPAISCLGLSWAELKQRNDLAYERGVAEMRNLDKSLTDNELYDQYALVAQGILWHTEFPIGLRLCVCDMELFEVAARLPLDLVAANGGEPLDFFDYAYVADVLREWLCDTTLAAGDMQNLRRALAWAEHKGSGLRDYSREL